MSLTENIINMERIKTKKKQQTKTMTNQSKLNKTEIT